MYASLLFILCRQEYKTNEFGRLLNFLNWLLDISKYSKSKSNNLYFWKIKSNLTKKW